MGKGDKKTRRGKINRGSYGVLRPRQKATTEVVSVKKPKPKVEPKLEEVTKKTTTKAATAKTKTAATIKKKTTAKKTVAADK
ncbi:30S ribosomal protein THX [Paucihalobacter sp.]|uniref:30S ribosomal protein THX n=1 Tax=Paucihalobacter sp. TaxID=2850405 RepID=UPI002FE38068